MATFRISASLNAKPAYCNENVNQGARFRKVLAFSSSAPALNASVGVRDLQVRATARGVFGGLFPRLVQRQPSSKRMHKKVRNICTAAAAAGTTGVYDTELSKGYEAVRLASQLCQKVQRQLSGDEKQSKNDDSPVTVADYGAQAIVAWSLQRAFPDTRLRMVAEEDSTDLQGEGNASIRRRITELVNSIITKEDPTANFSEQEILDLIDLGNSPGGSEGRHWILDPIDGTRGFVGGRQYAVCLGMIQDGEVVVGLLGCPNMPSAVMTPEDGTSAALKGIGAEGVGMCFAAQQGGGAHKGLLAAGLPAEPLLMKNTLDCTQARWMESYESRHSSHGTTEDLAKELGISSLPLRLDSQCKYGALARGDATIYLRFPPVGYREKIWDHAAGVVIVSEAGGKVTDAAGKKLQFGRGRWLDLEGGGIVAACPSLHSQLVDACVKLAA